MLPADQTHCGTMIGARRITAHPSMVATGMVAEGAVAEVLHVIAAVAAEAAVVMVGEPRDVVGPIAEVDDES